MGAAGVAVAAPADPGAGRVLARSVLRVVGFWWLTTGLIVALQRSPGTRLVALVLSAALALLGVRLLVQTRDDCSRRGAERAFVAGALLWLWVATTFYGGWIVGPPLDVPLPPERAAMPLALLALRATAYHEVLGLAVLAGAIALHGRNPVSWQAVGLFWLADKLGRLNVFLGVANPGTHFLPDHLAFLEGFFGPPRNSPLLVPTAVAFAALASWLLRRALRTDEPFTRSASALLAVLAALATLEHVVLGADWTLPLWDLFLAWRTSL